MREKTNGSGGSARSRCKQVLSTSRAQCRFQTLAHQAIAPSTSTTTYECFVRQRHKQTERGKSDEWECEGYLANERSEW